MNISEESCGSYFYYQKYDYNGDTILDFTQNILQSLRSHLDKYGSIILL